MSIVVSEEERDKEAVKILTQHFLTYIKTLKEKNSTISGIIADCISKDGEKYIRRLGMSEILKTSRKTILYEIKKGEGFLQ